MRKSFFLLALFLSLPLAAQVYKYTDEKGVVHYTDKPPSKDARPASLPPLHTYTPLPAEAPSAATPAPASPAGALEVRITSPAQDETYRDPTGTLVVSAEVSPAMPPGHSLLYYVDGVARGEPGVAALTLSGLERGQHSVEAALLNEQGTEVARSTTVTVHMHHPRVKRPPPATPRPAPR